MKYIYLIVSTFIISFSTSAQCLVAEYLFSGNVADSSTYQNNGNLVGASPATDRFGNLNSAFEFNSSIDYIQVPSSTSLQVDTAYTISCWVKPLNTYGTGPNYHAIVGKWGGTGDASYLLCLTPNGNPRLVTHDGTNNTELIAHTPIPLNQWTHLIVTQSHSTAAIYVNGVIDTMSTTMISPAIYTNQLLIGANSVIVNWDSFEGIIDEVEIYNCSGFETGINYQNTISLIDLFPNPTTGLVHLSEYFTGKISVFNSLGKKVCEKTDSDIIDLYNQTPGLYFIRFEKVDKNIWLKVLKL